MISGKTYEDTVLMRSLELTRRLRRMPRLKFRILIPAIPVEHIAQFRRSKAALARLFNRVSRMRVLRPLFLVIAPFFLVEGWIPE